MISGQEIDPRTVQMQQEMEDELAKVRGDYRKGTYSKFSISSLRAIALIDVRRILQAIQDVQGNTIVDLWLSSGFSAGKPFMVEIKISQMDIDKINQLQELADELKKRLSRPPVEDDFDMTPLLNDVKERL